MRGKRLEEQAQQKHERVVVVEETKQQTGVQIPRNRLRREKGQHGQHKANEQNALNNTDQRAEHGVHGVYRRNAVRDCVQNAFQEQKDK